MTTPTVHLLWASDVGVGDRLPDLQHHVTATTIVLGALASRDWRPMHHDRDFAVHHAGKRDIFMNTPNQAAWLERYLTDWAGPRSRLARMTFAMRSSVCPGDLITVAGRVTARDRDDVDCEWADVALTITVAGEVRTEATARIALPADADDNPWARRLDRWRP